MVTLCRCLMHYKEAISLSFLAAFSSRLVRTGSVSNNGSFTTVAGHLAPNSSTSTRDPISVSSRGKYAIEMLFFSL